MFRDVLVVLYCSDLERSVALYRDAFGMTESYRFPRSGPAEHVELRLGGTTLGLSSPEGLVSHGLPPVDRGSGQPFELAFGTTDADAAVERLQRAGCSVVRAPFNTAAGNRTGYVEDIDGNRISVYTPLNRG